MDDILLSSQHPWNFHGSKSTPTIVTAWKKFVVKVVVSFKSDFFYLLSHFLYPNKARQKNRSINFKNLLNVFAVEVSFFTSHKRKLHTREIKIKLKFN